MRRPHFTFKSQSQDHGTAGMIGYIEQNPVTSSAIDPATLRCVA
jgi:hypothetical protein